MMMSLVDYASSSDEDEPQQLQPPPPKQQPPNTSPERHSIASPNNNTRNLTPPTNKKMEVDSDQSSALKLPDASLLFDSPTVPSKPPNASSHSSRVAAAMAESATRKRDMNRPSSSYPRNKVPKGNKPHLRSVPDTVNGHLLPPQLAGRSNVVTEDITKLFVRKPTNSSA